MTESAPRIRIGYGLEPKKVHSFIQPSLVNLCNERGIDLVPIDINKPLIQQGPFDCVIHKLYSEDWKNQLEEFSKANPNTVIIDPPHAIERLHNRISMLEVVNELKITRASEKLGMPSQTFIFNSESLSDQSVLQGLNFPVIAKPLVADGSAISHKMCIVFSRDGLKGLNPPIVLQEFVNHGGVIFKVYVAGEHVQCAKRRSLPDIPDESLGSSGGLLSFSQVSNLACQDGDDDSYRLIIEEAKMPPTNFVNEIANALQQVLGLRLFNFDMIKVSRDASRYLVIDINYFPGYAKLPDFEIVLTDFFREVVCQKESAMHAWATKDSQE
ncbi:hypothetical protein RJ639_046514 [Escallonia herrerae]|uniref:Inositol-tetrakisphosphate 1-kinase n=1 Tax=Escallonia herrerae TaxID=1293975 RepID=A0AA88W5L6_9ASTE|nr:hypothetical protein RJ639_046514 [Escallonia herrerae]